MTLKVTVSIETGESYKAKVTPMDKGSSVNAPFFPSVSAAVIVAPGESKDFYVHSSNALHIHEIPLDGV